MNIGKAIKVCRTKKGYSQKKLAEMTSISASYLSLIEKNLREPTLEVLKNISDSMSIPVSVLTFLAFDSDEIESISPEIYEKLSAVTFKLLSSDE